MDDSAFFLACAALAVVGVLLLAYSSFAGSPQRVSISELSELKEGKFVEVRGEIKSIYARNGNFFLSLCSGDCIQAVIFSRVASQLSTHETNLYLLKKGERVRAIGKLQEYNGKPELVIEELEVLP